MKALFCKQLRLVCHPMTWAFCLFGSMFLIPNYPYTVVFFYVTLGLFFSFMNGREQRDADFTALLPVRKSDMVRVNVWFCVAVEVTTLLLGVPFACISARINPNGTNVVGLDCNVALFAAGFVLFAVFNSVFLPAFYRTGYKVGISYLKAVIPMALVMVLCEALPHFPMLEWLNDTSMAANVRQLPLLAVGVLLYAVCTWLACRGAITRYEKVDL